MGKTLLLFDVDGTLTAARRGINPEMRSFLMDVRAKGVPIAVVGGSDLNKITEQLADSDHDKLVSSFDYVFAENGVVGFHGKDQYSTKLIQDQMGEEKLQDLINFVLEYFSKLRLPHKRGNFVEFRKGMINFSPIGRSCSHEEREHFVAYDKEHKIRETFVKILEEKFSSYGLTFAIGGQISVDVYPNGWDKTYCLQYLENDFETIHFFGDRTMPGGNDHAIYVDKRVIGHSVEGPNDTKKQVEETLNTLH
ncbi:unnamed protein product, partial [Mesorhabditis belari]|uniref:Phosphomannomutase n=1 Tax=Mesorhabditis belari TaxID=2138241 RepID=A0AAF3FMK4_9BILA